MSITASITGNRKQRVCRSISLRINDRIRHRQPRQHNITQTPMLAGMSDQERAADLAEVPEERVIITTPPPAVVAAQYMNRQTIVCLSPPTSLNSASIQAPSSSQSSTSLITTPNTRSSTTPPTTVTPSASVQSTSSTSSSRLRRSGSRLLAALRRPRNIGSFYTKSPAPSRDGVGGVGYAEDETTVAGSVSVTKNGTATTQFGFPPESSQDGQSPRTPNSPSASISSGTASTAHSSPLIEANSGHKLSRPAPFNSPLSPVLEDTNLETIPNFSIPSATLLHSELVKQKKSLRGSKSVPNITAYTSAGGQQVNIRETVIKRTGLFHRPTILPFDNKIHSSDQLREHEILEEMAMSPYPTPVTPPKTKPFSSNIHSKTLPIDSKRRNSALISTLWSSSPTSMVAKQNIKLNPSIHTSETAAAAKVYLETYFNTLLSPGLTPRSLRRHKVQDELQALGLSPMTSNQVMRQWANLESNHLREYRAAKSMKSYFGEWAQKNGNTAVGRYEAIRVLGKGSFGVVKLVRDRLEMEASSSSKLGSSEHSPFIPKKRSHVDTNQLYAMKVIRKNEMIRNCQEGHLRAERDFLVASEMCQWVVPLRTTFQDESNLYLVMDYMVGGDFLGLLLREDVLDEPVARWYIAEMVLCIEEAHRMRWIHRDVKPDNFLIGADGHLKISDFGLAFDGHWSHCQQYFHDRRYALVDRLGITVKGDAQDEVDDLKDASRRPKNFRSPTHKGQFSKGHHRDETILDHLNRTSRRRYARSVVGTSQYMAPEVIRAEDYDSRCDWWSIGIILYECLYGCTPFYADRRTSTKRKILQHTTQLKFPSRQRMARPSSTSPIPLPSVSALAIDLIFQLLQERQNRLSCGKYRINDLASCPQPSVTSTPFRGLKSGNQNSPIMPFQRQFVVPDDAEDIKRHPFFRGMNWDNITRQRPPFVPCVKAGQGIDKYFDKEEDLIGGSDEDSARGTKSEPKVPKSSSRKKQKEKKRPRDKILRDPNLGQQVIEIRKRYAFQGYTYRRPNRFTINSIQPYAELTSWGGLNGTLDRSFRTDNSSTAFHLGSADLHQPSSSVNPISQQPFPGDSGPYLDV